MKTIRADDIKADDTVWAWHGSWFPTVVADVVLESGRKLLIVRFENGGSAPVLFADVVPRDPDARGTDRPHNHSRAWRSAHPA